MDQIRSFVSIDIDESRVLSELASVLSSLQSIGGDLKTVERENIHVTLKFLGNVDSSKLAQVKAALGQVKFVPFSLEVRGAGAFPSLSRMNVVWVGLGQGWSHVEEIYAQTEKLLSEAGFRKETRAFSPHVTVARVKSARKRDEIAGFLQRITERTFGTLQVDKVRLKQSVLSSSGPKYSTLSEFPAQVS